ncbi:MAG: zinc protease [Pseudonocardiales bacterium]|jgi:zinc protease|nr:putative M16-family peptidase [Pseudonocardiales bacterium]MDT4964491.1 zinc protease [Pseudonocardiales bacterium]MDT4982508.1 zinc protease [Pseudonocardiales bacterium]MDT4985224.1 zinc protease [Pseudonocardiales bacterium]
MTVPALTKPRTPKRLTVSERTTESGLRVIAVRKPGVPIVEMRLRLPFASARATHSARSALLSDSMLTGAAGYDRAGLAAAVQALGGDLSVGVDADRLMVAGNVLATNLRPLLGLLATVLNDATYPDDEVATERDRLVEKLSMARSRAGVVASEALSHRMWGEHPYTHSLPQPDAVAATTPAQVRKLHADMVRPGRAVLVVVGDISPARALDQVEAALGDWTGRAPVGRIPALPGPEPSPLLIIDRPGSVQSSLRMGASALSRTDERYPALQLANMIFGGYFSSRWTENIREDKGYTYGPHSRIEHNVLGSSLMLDVEVATEVTGPALLETLYELGKIASLPVTEAEVDSVRQYAIGTLALSTATQAGLASTLSALAAFGLGLDWMIEHPRNLAATSVDDVSAAAAEFLAPARLTSVVVGDAQTITAPLAALVPVTTEP